MTYYRPIVEDSIKVTRAFSLAGGVHGLMEDLPNGNVRTEVVQDLKALLEGNQMRLRARSSTRSQKVECHTT